MLADFGFGSGGDDWKSPAISALPVVLGTVSSNGPIILGGPLSQKRLNAVHSSQCASLSDSARFASIEGGSAPLLQAVSQARRARTAPSGLRLPGVRTASGRLGKKTASRDAEDVREVNLKQSGKTLRLWSKINDSTNRCMRYEVPLSCASTSVGSLSLAASCSFSDKDFLESIPIRQGETSLEDDGMDHELGVPLFLSQAADYLADTNLSNFAAKDAIRKLKDACASITNGEADDASEVCAPGFTQRYFKTVNTYGSMIDKVRDLTREVTQLDAHANLLLDEENKEVEDRKNTASAVARAKKQDAIALHERAMLVQALKDCLQKFDAFNWDHLAFDFKRWLQSAELNEAVLREMLEQIAQQEKDVLQLLAVSRYLIEESLGMHLLNAARTLTNFHDCMKRHTKEVDRHLIMQGEERISPKESHRSGIKKHFDQLAEERDRQKRQLEVNRNLYNTVVHATTPEAKAGKMTSDSNRRMSARDIKMKQRTTVVVAEQPDSPLGSSKIPASSSATTKPFKSVEVSPLARRHSHIENNFARCIVAGKLAIETTETVLAERSQLLERMKKWTRRKAKMEAIEDQKGFVVSDLAKVSYLNAAEEAEVRSLLRKRMDLWQQLNEAKVSVTVHDFLKAEEREDHAKIPHIVVNEIHLKDLLETHPETGETATRRKSDAGKTPVITEKRRRGIVASSEKLGDVMAALTGMKQDPNTEAQERHSEQKRAMEEARLVQTQKVEEFQTTLNKGYMRLQKVILKSSGLVDKANAEFGFETWDYNMEESRVCFMRNPQVWIAEALKDAAEEFCQAKFSISAYRNQVEQLRENLTELHEEFQKERQARLEAFFERIDVEDTEWASSLNHALSTQISSFSHWYKKAGATSSIETGKERTTQEYILSQISDPKLVAQKQIYEKTKVEKAKQERLAYAEEMYSESLAKDIQKFDSIEERCARFVEMKERREQDEITLGNIVQEIQQVTNSRKQLQLQAMRGSQMGSSITGLALVGKLMSRVKLAQAAKKVADERKASVMQATMDASNIGGRSGSQIGEIAAKAAMDSKASKERATMVAGEAHKAALIALARSSTWHNSSKASKAELRRTATNTSSETEVETEEPDSWSIEALARGDVQALLSGKGESDIRIDASLLELNDFEITELINAAQSPEEEVVFNSALKTSFAQAPSALAPNSDEKLQKNSGSSGTLDSHKAGVLTSIERSRLRDETEKATMDKKKIDSRMLEETSKAKVLEVRRDRRRVDFARMCKKAARMAGNEEDVKMAEAKTLDSEQLKEKWHSDMTSFRNQLKTAEKMIAFWKKRNEAWHGEILDTYGDATLNELLDEDARAQRRKMGLKRKMHLHRGSATSFSANAQTKRKSLRRSTTRASVVFAHVGDGEDGWEAAKDASISSVFCDAFSALNVTTAGRNKPVQNPGSSEHLMKMIMQKGNAFNMDQIDARLGGIMGFRAGHRASFLKLGGGFLPDDKQAGRLGLASFGFNLGTDARMRGHRVPGAIQKKWQNQATEAARMRIMDFMMESPIAFGSIGAKHGRVKRGRPVLLDASEKERRKGPHYGKLQTVNSRKSKAKVGFATLPEIPEESPRGNQKPQRPTMAKYRFSMAPQNHRNSTQDRLQALKSRRRDSLLGSEDRGLFTSSVAMLRMFCDDVSEGKDTQAAKDDAAQQEQEKAERVAKRLLRKSLAEINWAPTGALLAEASDPSSSHGSDSDSGLSSDKEGIPKYRQRKHADDEVWCSKNRKTKGVHLLRVCRDAFIQRFGGLDKAYVKLVPAVLGLTSEVFQSIVVMMDFSDDDADIMFEVLLNLLRKPVPSAARNLVQAETKHQSPSPILDGIGKSKDPTMKFAVPRQEFCDAMRSIAPVRTLTQLRARIRRKHQNFEHAFRACVGANDDIAADSFRDFLATSGVDVKEARHLFHQMMENCAKRVDGTTAMRLDKHAFISSLVHAEGLTAAQRIRKQLKLIARRRKQDAGLGRFASKDSAGSSSSAHSKDRRRRASGEFAANSKHIWRRTSVDNAANNSRAYFKHWSRASDGENANHSREPSKEGVGNRRDGSSSRQSSRQPSKEKLDRSNLGSQRPSRQQSKELAFEHGTSRRQSAQQAASDADGQTRRSSRRRSESGSKSSSRTLEENASICELREPSERISHERSSERRKESQSAMDDHLIDLHGPTSLMRRESLRSASKSSLQSERTAGKYASREDSKSPSRASSRGVSFDEPVVSREPSPSASRRASTSSAHLLPSNRRSIDQPEHSGNRGRCSLIHSDDGAKQESNLPLKKEMAADEKGLGYDSQGAENKLQTTDLTNSRDALSHEEVEKDTAKQGPTSILRMRRRSSGLTDMAVVQTLIEEHEDPDKKLYNTFVCQLDAHCDVTAPIKVEQFQSYAKSILISPEEAFALFRLTGAGKQECASVQDIIMRILGGFGHKYHEMRSKFGLLPVNEQRKAKKGTSRHISLNDNEDLNELGGLMVGRRPVDKSRVETAEKHAGRSRLARGVASRSRQIGRSVGPPRLTGCFFKKAAFGAKEDAFEIGESVEFKHRGKWIDGVVTSINPLKVRYAIVPDSDGLRYDEVRRKVCEDNKKRRQARQSALVENPAEDSACTEPPSGIDASAEDNMDENPTTSMRTRLGTASSSSTSSDEQEATSPTNGKRISVEDAASKRILKHSRTLPIQARDDVTEGNTGEKSAKLFSLDLGDVDGESPPRSPSSASPASRKKRRTAVFLRAKRESTPASPPKESSNLGLSLDLTNSLPEQEENDNTEKQPMAERKGFRKATTKFTRTPTQENLSRRKTLVGGELSIGQELATSNTWAFTMDDVDSVRPRSESKDDTPKSSEVLDDVSPRDFASEQVYLKALESMEVEKHSRRLDLFSGNSIELEIATRKLQECRERLISHFKSLPKAFDSLAGARDATTTLKALQEKIARFLKFNSLDSERMSSLAATVVNKDKIDFTEFLSLWRFAEPVSSLLDFRKRLVLLYGTVDAAFNVLHFHNGELSIDLFEKPMIVAGIVAKDCDRLFKLMDKVQSGGPRGFLSCSTIRWILDNGHVLGWLEILQVRFGGRAGMKKALDKLPVLKRIEDRDAPIDSAADLVPVMSAMGFPGDFVPNLYRLLELRNSGPVTIRSLLQLLSIAFDEREGRAMDSSTSGGSGQGTDQRGSISEVGPTEDEKNRGLTLTTELRRYVVQNFADAQAAFAAFHPKRPDAGITLEEWEAAMVPFGYSDAYAWALIFGHIVEWQHSRWDPKYRSTSKGITLESLASALNKAAPVSSLAALRARLLDKCGSLQQAWIQLTGKDNAEEIGLAQWQQALRGFWVGLADAGQLFALLKVASFTLRHADHQILLRSRFLWGLRTDRAIDVQTRMLDLTLLLMRRHGSVSVSFEGRYPLEPLLVNAFEDAVAGLLQVPRQDVRPIFAPLSAHSGMQREALAMVTDLMDALVDIQAFYLPYSSPQMEENVRRVRMSQRSPRSPRTSSGYNLLAFSPMAKPPDGITTGSTTIPEDESDNNGSPADSGNENRPGTSPTAAKRARNAARSSIEAFAEESSDQRPITAPHDGSARQKPSLRGMVNAMRAAPLPMNLRSFANESNTNQKESLASTDRSGSLVLGLSGGSAFLQRNRQATERAKIDSPLPEVHAKGEDGRTHTPEKAAAFAPGWTKTATSNDDPTPVKETPRAFWKEEQPSPLRRESSALTSNSIIQKVFQGAHVAPAAVDLASHVEVSADEKASLFSYLATHGPSLPSNNTSAQLTVSGLGGKGNDFEALAEPSERKKPQTRGSIIVGGAGVGILGGLVSSLQGSGQDKVDSERGLNLSGSGLGCGQGRVPTSAPRVPAGIGSLSLNASATAAAAAIIAGRGRK